MILFALNHMTVARLSFRDLVALAARLDCVGIEVRNDLPQPLFDGMDPGAAGDLVRDACLRLLAVAEVKRFNDWSEDKAAEALALMKIAKAAGAEAVSLIPPGTAHCIENTGRRPLRILCACTPAYSDADTDVIAATA